MTATRKRRERTWRPGPDYRVVCDCQRHARRERSFLRRTLRMASRGAAVLVTVPLALAALDFPIEAMNFNVGERTIETVRSMRAASVPAAPREPSGLRIFTTPGVSEHF